MNPYNLFLAWFAWKLLWLFSGGDDASGEWPSSGGIW